MGYVFVIGIVLMFIGVGICIKGDASKFNLPAGGGASRIPPMQQARFNNYAKDILNHDDTPDKYVGKGHIFRFNKLGIILSVIGLVFIIISSLKK